MMLPILAAIGVSILGSLASKAASSLIERMGGGAASDAGATFSAVLEKSQATRSSRTAAGSADLVAQLSGSMATGGGLVRTPVLSGSTQRTTGHVEGAALSRLISEVRNQASLSPLVAAARPVGGNAAAGYVGRKVAANGSMITLAGGVTPQLRYQLPRAAGSVQVEVRDLHGKLVRAIQLGPQAGGLHLLPFDGRGLQAGQYVYRVVAADADGGLLAGVSTAFGRVTGVQFEGGAPFLNVGRSLVPLAGVYAVSSEQRPAFA